MATASASAAVSAAWLPVGISQPVTPGCTMPSTLAAWDSSAGSAEAAPSSAALASPS